MSDKILSEINDEYYSDMFELKYDDNTFRIYVYDNYHKERMVSSFSVTMMHEIKMMPGNINIEEELKSIIQYEVKAEIDHHKDKYELCKIKKKLEILAQL